MDLGLDVDISPFINMFQTLILHKHHSITTFPRRRRETGANIYRSLQSRQTPLTKTAILLNRTRKQLAGARGPAAD